MSNTRKTEGNFELAARQAIHMNTGPGEPQSTTRRTTSINIIDETGRAQTISYANFQNDLAITTMDSVGDTNPFGRVAENEDDKQSVGSKRSSRHGRSHSRHNNVLSEYGATSNFNEDHHLSQGDIKTIAQVFKRLHADSVKRASLRKLNFVHYPQMYRERHSISSIPSDERHEY